MSRTTQFSDLSLQLELFVFQVYKSLARKLRPTVFCDVFGRNDTGETAGHAFSQL